LREYLTNIKNIKIFNDKKNIIIKSKYRLECLSNASINGGRVKIKNIVNHHVPLNFKSNNLQKELKFVKIKYKLSNSTVGLFTAVNINDAVNLNNNIDDINYTIIITAGIGNASIPLINNIENKIEKFFKYKPGTINTILLINGKLSEHALVNLFIVITEIKTYFFNCSNIKTKHGLSATGTSTDTIVIAYTNKGGLIEWAGPATKFGGSIGNDIFLLLQKTIYKSE